MCVCVSPKSADALIISPAAAKMAYTYVTTDGYRGLVDYEQYMEDVSLDWTNNKALGTTSA